VRRGSVSRVATLKESEAEVISFDVSENARILGIPLAAAEFPDHAIVAALVREGRVMVPRGTDALQVGDEAIVFALGDAIEAVTALFPS
jgi:trk system potassium uptake protein TrkA